MGGDICPMIKRSVIIQENGIIRLSGSGLLIGRLVEGTTYESLIVQRLEETRNGESNVGNDNSGVDG